MKGLMKAAAGGLCLAAGLVTQAGCYQYRQWVDPCWPERYNAEARHSVRDTFAAQAQNGHVLDQTVWNSYFEVDPRTGPTDKLNEAGMEHLQYLARRQPAPDANLFLQTAQDVPNAAAMPLDKLAQVRSDLDNKRVGAVQKYMAGLMTGRSQAVSFDVAVIDPAEVGMAASGITGSGYMKQPVIKGALNQWYDNFKGKMAGQEGITITTTGGS